MEWAIVPWMPGLKRPVPAARSCVPASITKKGLSAAPACDMSA